MNLRSLLPGAVLLLAGVALAASGHFQLDAYFQTTLKDPSYQQHAFERVMKKWKAPREKPAPGKKTVVRAFIAKDGTLTGAKVSYNSGSEAWDAAALAAVKAAAPFGPLPKDFGYPSVEGDFHFSWAAGK